MAIVKAFELEVKKELSDIDFIKFKNPDQSSKQIILKVLNSLSDEMLLNEIKLRKLKV